MVTDLEIQCFFQPYSTSAKAGVGKLWYINVAYKSSHASVCMPCMVPGILEWRSIL